MLQIIVFFAISSSAFAITEPVHTPGVDVVNFMQRFRHLECSPEGANLLGIDRMDQARNARRLKLLKFGSPAARDKALENCRTQIDRFQISIEPNLDLNEVELNVDRRLLYVILDKETGKRVFPGWYAGSGVATSYEATLKNMAEILFERLN